MACCSCSCPVSPLLQPACLWHSETYPRLVASPHPRIPASHALCFNAKTQRRKDTEGETCQRSNAKPPHASRLAHPHILTSSPRASPHPRIRVHHRRWAEPQRPRRAPEGRATALHHTPVLRLCPFAFARSNVLTLLPLRLCAFAPLR